MTILYTLLGVVAAVFLCACVWLWLAVRDETKFHEENDGE
jgi:hypothetical protein